MRSDAPPCSHRPPCPACPRYGETGIASRARDALAVFAREAGLPEPEVEEGAASGFRHRARLSVRGRASSPKIGIFQLGSHRIVDIPRCPIHHPLVNRVSAALKRAIRSEGIPPYADRPHTGALRGIQVVVERGSQRAQVVLIENAERHAKLAGVAESLIAELGDALHSLWWNGNAERTNTILGAHWRHLHGPERVCERIGRAEVFFPPGAFGQSHLALADRMVERIARWVPDDRRVLEFHAGCGSIGLNLLPGARSLECVEIAPASLDGLAHGLARRPDPERQRARIHAGPAVEFLSRIEHAQVVVVDPPRKGLDEALVSALCATPPEQLVYLSCGLDSFLRDAERLQREGGLMPTALRAYALFPYTEHVETLARFERVRGTASAEAGAARR